MECVAQRVGKRENYNLSIGVVIIAYIVLLKLINNCVNTNSHEFKNNCIPNTLYIYVYSCLVYICLFISCIWLFNSPILINRINASIRLLLPNIHTLSHGIRAFKINRNQSVQNQQKSERSRSTEIRNQSVQQHQKQQQKKSWPQSKT